LCALCSTFFSEWQWCRVCVTSQRQSQCPRGCPTGSVMECIMRQVTLEVRWPDEWHAKQRCPNHHHILAPPPLAGKAGEHALQHHSGPNAGARVCDCVDTHSKTRTFPTTSTCSKTIFLRARPTLCHVTTLVAPSCVLMVATRITSVC
jgi:hypothetical protein